MPSRRLLWPSRRNPAIKLLRRSLVARILGTHALGIVVAAALTLGGVNLLLQLRTHTLEHQRLEDQASDVIAALLVSNDAQLQLDYGATMLSRNGGSFSFLIRDAQGRDWLSSPNAQVTRLSGLRLHPGVKFETLRDGDVLSTITRHFEFRGQPFWVTVAWNLSAPGVIFDNVLDGFVAYSSGITLVLLTTLLGIDLLMMRASLRPLVRIVRAVRQSQRSDEYRLRLRELPREVLPMARAYNNALSRAERAFRLQREFTADAAHELRTPLAVLQARLETLPPGKTRQQLLRDIEVMSRIVSQLLQMAGLDRPEPRSSASTDPVAVCHDVVEALAPIAIATGRELGLTVPDGGVPHLQIGSDDLFQVLRNLVENAIHHTSPGVHIDVAAERDGSLVVSDDGPGIPAELQASVFERFWRRDRQTRSGAGLGLAIVRRLVTRAGGTVELTSAVGCGCRFLLRLPCVPAAELPAATRPGGSAERPWRATVDSSSTVETAS